MQTLKLLLGKDLVLEEAVYWGQEEVSLVLEKELSPSLAAFLSLELFPF